MEGRERRRRGKGKGENKEERRERRVYRGKGMREHAREGTAGEVDPPFPRLMSNSRRLYNY